MSDDTTDDLAEWVEVWNRVCATAWGDDDKPAPRWADVAKAELQGWGALADTADNWSSYMKARLVHLVENHLHAVGRWPAPQKGVTMHFPKDIPPNILSRADELLSAKYGTDRPIDPEIVELMCRGMMEERENGRRIIRAYAEEVAYCEGATFIGGGVSGLTDEENAFLLSIDADIAKAIRGTE